MSRYYRTINSSALASLSERVFALNSHWRALTFAALWALVASLLIGGPWLGGGYIFGTDWPGPRRFDYPTVLSNSAPLEALLAAASQAVTSEWAGKLFVLGFLFVAGLMAFRAAPASGLVPRAAAATIYVFNPFVFGRLHYGQMFVLAGYALLPWVAIRLRVLLQEPSWKSGLLLALSLAVLSITSSHLFLVAGVLVAAVLLAQFVTVRRQRDYLLRLGKSLLIAAGATLVACAYWLLPLVLGRGVTADIIASISPTDLRTFAAVPDGRLGLLPNLLGLYGFWAENTNRFTSMKDFVPDWPLALAVLLAIGAIGAFSAFRRRGDQLAPWVAGLLIAGVIALVLEMGVSNHSTSGLVTWIDAHFGFYRGMRDAGKWAALLALVYSQLIGVGAAAILDWVAKPRFDRRLHGWPVEIATGLLLALPVFYGNGLLYGMHGEIRPSQYPAGWYAVDRVLAADSHPGRALFLPWHEYMAYSFIQNQNKIVASPAPTFFSIPVLVSANPEVSGIAAPSNPDQVAISNLVAAGGQGHWSTVLTALNIEYVLVAREVDWASFRYLDDQAGLVKVGDFGSIVLYRNGPSQSAAPAARHKSLIRRQLIDP